MQKIDTRRWLRQGWREKQRILLHLMILSLSLLGCWAMSAAAESPVAPVTAETISAPASQERFLQHFISRSLGQKAAAEHEASPPAAMAASSPTHTATSGAPSSPALGLSAPTSTTVTTMVLSLGAILGCLLMVGYFIRRCLFSQTFLSKSPVALRVLARTHLTPKAVVALLEVPGKTLVIGVTGSTLVTLGEAVMPVAENDEPSVIRSSPSFVTTLEESTHDLHDAEQGDETLLQVSERIQRKVSRLKQL